MKPVLEFSLFALGWLCKGILWGLASQAIFQPLSKHIWRWLRRKAEAHAYVAHHVQQHPTFSFKDCATCRTPGILISESP